MSRSEYPRPQFVREDWLNLNGEWDFEFDDHNVGEDERWSRGERPFSKKINVPFAFQSKLSGICDPSFHDVVWYKRSIEVSDEWQDKRVILHFGAVDYYTKVYVNGSYVGDHTGGHTPFSFDITNEINRTEGEDDEIIIRVEDPSTDETIPRGKQYWHENPGAIWYTRTTGIWQTVWLEPVSNSRIENVKMTPHVDTGEIEIDFNLSPSARNKQIQVDISFKGKALVSDIITAKEEVTRRKFYLFNNKIDRSEFHGVGWTWRPEDPNLFDVTFKLFDEDQTHDSVESYFGMRKVHQENGMVYLNNRPYYQKLILDQGYWPSSLMTAPTNEDFKKDILMAKELGFNGCRKHQKVEDPRFLYWADKLGFIVWGECAAPAVYTNEAANALTKEWMEIVERDYNHPSIIVWVPINESWGVPEIGINRTQQHYSKSIYHFIHSIDPTRLVISNDGWEMTETDIAGIHNYAHGHNSEAEKYEHFVESLRTKRGLLSEESNRRGIYAKGFKHQGEPIILTECGGIGLSVSDDGWGHTSVGKVEDLIRDYKRVIDAVYGSKALVGFCYTQLTDIEQEQNGLLTYGREFKCDPKEIRKINDQWHRETIDQVDFNI